MSGSAPDPLRSGRDETAGIDSTPLDAPVSTTTSGPGSRPGPGRSDDLRKKDGLRLHGGTPMRIVVRLKRAAPTATSPFGRTRGRLGGIFPRIGASRVDPSSSGMVSPGPRW
jgi:hypothetical protein